MANATIDNLVDALHNHAGWGAEGSIPAAQAATLLERFEAPVYPQEASSLKERQFEDRELLRGLAARALAGRTSDGMAA